MFRTSRAAPYPPQLDLSTMRDTLAYMHDDARRIPGLEALAEALAAAQREAESAERRAARPVSLEPVKPLESFGARFLPRRA